MLSLTRDEAGARAALLHIHGYRIDLDLSTARDGGSFTSTTTVTFACRSPGAASFVEVRPESVVEARLNGVELDPAALVDNRLPLTGLRAENELTVRATIAFSHTGEGVHRFTDPTDDEVYLYGQSPLDNAQRIFACFDQPDLKATVRLAVTVDPGWTVWANAPGTRTAPGRWEFAETPRLSTYHVTFVAGPYHSRHAEHDGIPLSLSCRRSLAPALDRDVEEIFTATRACFDRFHELFGVRYPFGDYHQAFVPEFTWGAVENPGCVTFREESLFRSAVTEADRELRTVVIAHEMAHMWFGDLVTLRWWDDVWLNEAFAEYLGWRVAAEVGGYPDAWSSFALWRKAWGYAADQRPTTHPVASDSVPDTAHALVNFDGISYAKGASALRQLAAWLGDDAFLSGVRAHIAAHAFGNASLADFLTALTGTTGRDVAQWAEVWLRRAQVNTLVPEVTLGPDGRYAEVTVVQTAPAGYPTLRPHRIGVGVYAGDGPVTLRRRVEVDLDPTVDGGRTVVAALRGEEPGRLLLLNDGDLTYAKIRFGAAGLAGLRDLLGQLTDPLARALVWAAAADSTRDGELTPSAYLALVAAGLPAESAVVLFESVVRFARTVVADRFVPPADRPAVLASLAGVCRSVLAGAAPGTGRQLAAARGLISCTGPADASVLAGWLAGRGVPAGLAVDAELRWAALGRLVVLGTAGPAEIAAEAAADPSASGVEHAARCGAAVADPAVKEEAWERVMRDDTGPAQLVAATAGGFWHPEQADLTASYVDRYFAEAPQMAARRTDGTVQRVAALAFPHYSVTTGTVTAAEAMLARADLDPTLRRVAADAADDLRRALAVRAASG